MVDYKTGKRRRRREALAGFEAMFQMAVLRWHYFRSRGVPPARLRLIYLADGRLLTGRDEAVAFQKKTLMAIWRAIQSAEARRGDFRPSHRGSAIGAHQQRCPAFSGTTAIPGWPEPAA